MPDRKGDGSDERGMGYGRSVEGLVGGSEVLRAGTARLHACVRDGWKRRSVSVMGRASRSFGPGGAFSKRRVKR